MNKANNVITGNSGEDLACGYLKRNGYKILDRNYRNDIGEIDIIAKHKGVIVFVEVKCRTSDYFGMPKEAVGLYKQNKIRKVALGYLKHKRLGEPAIRFDVIEVLGGEINHIENCF